MQFVNKNYKDSYSPSGLHTNLAVNKIRTLLFGSISWYYTIISGGLVTSLMLNPVIIELDNREFNKTLKNLFQIPRGDIAHNQVTMVGQDESYASYVQIFLDGLSKGEFLIQGPESIAPYDLQIDPEGNYFIESCPFKHFPAANINAEALVNDEKIQPMYTHLMLAARENQTIYVYYQLFRNVRNQTSITFYFADKICLDLANIQKHSFLTFNPERSKFSELESKSSLHEIAKSNDDITKLINHSIKFLSDHGAKLTINPDLLICKDMAHESPVDLPRKIISRLYPYYARESFKLIESHEGNYEEPVRSIRHQGLKPGAHLY